MPVNHNNAVCLEHKYPVTAEPIFDLFKNNTLFQITGADEIEVDFQTGGKFSLIFHDRGNIWGHFIAVMPNVIVINWNVDGFQLPSESNTLVEIHLLPQGESCTLKLTHKYVNHPAALAAKNRAWTEILFEIKSRIDNRLAPKSIVVTGEDLF